ncbi:MAG: hypothetical protein ACYC2R_08600 [Burkholderiales bacterium]
MPQLFPFGRLLATPGALAALQTCGVSPLILLSRHVSGDWSDMTQEDQQRNRDAIHDGSRVFSGYDLAEGVRIWVITEADRASTTILLPSEY